MTLELPGTAEVGGERLQALTGEVLQVLWQSPDGRFSVVRFRPEGASEEVVAVGDLGSVTPGEPLRLLGRWGEHPQHGRRFEVRSFTPVVPTGPEGLIRFLGSGLISGVGPALARRLVERFGERTLDVITSESGRLREVEGIGPARARAIAQAVRKRREEAESMAFLHSLGLGPATARKVLRRYGDQAVQALREDPYRVAEDISGLGFQIADRIARHLGIGECDPRRVAGAVLHLLRRGTEEGHVYATEDSLREGLEQLGVPSDALPSVLHTLARRRAVVLEGEAVYETGLYRAERLVAERIARLAARPPRRRHDLRRLVERSADAQLTDEQLQAVATSIEGHVLVLTGGPGTGKTTTVRSVVAAQRRMGRKLLLCAPTGRAAKRLAEATGHPAKTIHRALEWNPQLGRFQRGEGYPLDADVVLVDEASMMDLPLAAALLEALPDDASLVLVGDVDQLPPVGPGQVLRDVIASGHVPTVRLTQVFRQAEKSAIVRAAHAILRGSEPEPTPRGERGAGDLHFVAATEPEQVAQRLLAVLDRIAEAYGLDPRHDVQVLTPMRKGPLGTERLNALLQRRLNPRARGDGVPAAGDRVMQLRNDYEREVFNGDVGEVVDASGGRLVVRFDGRTVRYEGDAREALTLAYASTVHKVQGGEFPAVVLVMHSSHHVLLDRALLYTGVTRGKRLVVLLGERRAIRRAVWHAARRDVRSRLRERITERLDAA